MSGTENQTNTDEGQSELTAVVMPGWVDAPRRNPPPEGVMVEVRGSDYIGDWFGVAMRKDYKPGSTKKQLKRGWRWCYENGDRFDDQAIDAWKMREA